MPYDTAPRTCSPGTRAAYRVEVRAHGVVTEVPGAGPADHLCWVYEDDAAFDEAAHEFLAGGLARGERLLCVGERVIDRLRALTPPVADVAALIARGALETLTLAEAYEATEPFLPEQQLAYYDSATRRAMDDGYRGLRVIAEVTDLAADRAQRAELVRWEHLADVASVHPLLGVPEEISSFRLFVDGHRLALAGSVDTFSSDRLARVLSSARAKDDGVVLDVATLEFMDVAGCRALARWAADLSARSVAVEVTGSSALLRRMWDVLDLARLAPVTFAEALA